jgi:hypothetical protein
VTNNLLVAQLVKKCYSFYIAPYVTAVSDTENCPKPDNSTLRLSTIFLMYILILSSYSSKSPVQNFLRIYHERATDSISVCLDLPKQTGMAVKVLNITP